MTESLVLSMKNFSAMFLPNASQQFKKQNKKQENLQYFNGTKHTELSSFLIPMVPTDASYLTDS